jgi:hypothetical protein
MGTSIGIYKIEEFKVISPCLTSFNSIVFTPVLLALALMLSSWILSLPPSLPLVLLLTLSVPTYLPKAVIHLYSFKGS